MNYSYLMRVGALAASAAVILLLVQVGIGAGIGADLALISKSVDPARMTSFLTAQARALTLLMTADDGFALAYGLAFVALALYLVRTSRLAGALVLGFALATTVTDLTENSLTLGAVETVTQGQRLDGNVLLGLFLLGQLKYLLIYFAALVIAVGLWNEGRAGRVMSVLFALFPVIGLAGVAVPEWGLGRVVWMVLLLAGGAVFLWRAGRD